MLSPFENIEITIIEIKTILPMSEDIGSWSTNLMVANLVLFTALWWLWEKRTKTYRGSLVVFVFVMITFALATTSAILAALGNSLCQIVFCLACVCHLPMLLALWILARRHACDLERLKSKIENE